MPEALPSTWLSLMPALVTITLAFLTRQVIASLAAGILTGGLVVLILTGSPSEANPISRYLIPSIGSKSYAGILLIYLWCLGGLIGMWEKTGGARHFADTIGARLATGRKSSLGVAWALGVVFHQGGTVSTVLTGSTVKPVADRNDVSHEELAYVVDSTASPVATLLAFNAWPLYVAGVVAGTIPLLADEAMAQRFFWSAVPFNFYAWFAVLGTLLFALGWLPWIGGNMAKARRRAIEEGLLDRPGAEPMLARESGPSKLADGYSPHMADFAVPLGVLLGVAIVPFILFRENFINEAFMGSLLSAMVVAKARGMTLKDIIEGFLSGCQQMTIGAIVLGLAVTLGNVSKDLGTAPFVVETIGNGIPALALPALLMLLCMGIAFATGTSWGTYAVIFPVAMPLAWSLNTDPLYIQVCFAAVLGGGVFGDQCSPISDTTILSSMFTGCDLMDHVRTQFPLALGAAALAALCSTLVVAL